MTITKDEIERLREHYRPGIAFPDVHRLLNALDASEAARVKAEGERDEARVNSGAGLADAFRARAERAEAERDEAITACVEMRAAFARASDAMGERWGKVDSGTLYAEAWGTMMLAHEHAATVSGYFERYAPRGDLVKAEAERDAAVAGAAGMREALAWALRVEERPAGAAGAWTPYVEALRAALADPTGAALVAEADGLRRDRDETAASLKRAHAWGDTLTARVAELEGALRACDVNVPDLREHVYSVVTAALAGSDEP